LGRFPSSASRQQDWGLSRASGHTHSSNFHSLIKSTAGGTQDERLSVSQLIRCSRGCHARGPAVTVLGTGSGQYYSLLSSEMGRAETWYYCGTESSARFGQVTSTCYISARWMVNSAVDGGMNAQDIVMAPKHGRLETFNRAMWWSSQGLFQDRDTPLRW
jgi:hypothetical protein